MIYAIDVFSQCFRHHNIAAHCCAGTETPGPAGSAEMNFDIIASSYATFVKYAPSSDDIESGWRNHSFIASSYAAFMRSSSSGRGLQVMWPVVLLMTSMRYAISGSSFM